MPSAGGVYLFFLGLACGIALLTATSYRRVSPRWLRWLLIVSGVFVMSRYATMALFTATEAPRHFLALRPCWFATSIGLTLPSVFALDQLLRHPAMTPRKLLIWFSPFLAVYGLVLLFAGVTLVPDRLVGWALHLGSGWQVLLSLTQGVFVIGFIGISVMLMRKIPAAPIRLALLGLAAGQAYLGLDGLLQALGRWYFRPFLYSEMLMLLALWHAYETSAKLQSGA
ncbi:MAG: hypothetical protein HY353_02815 [Candidatus Omnitrophica bacterium]|nr:hypothetical protein [Candidatus Omnitrophota bacterium]